MEQGQRQECVLATVLFKIVFAAIVKMDYTHFRVTYDVMGAFSASKEENGGAGGEGEQPAKCQSYRCRFLGMLYADDAVSPEKLKKIMGGDRNRVCGVCAHLIGGQDYDHVFKHVADAGVHHRVQRRGNGPREKTNERVRIPRGECQPQCRPVIRGQPAHTQSMVQLPEVHSQTV